MLAKHSFEKVFLINKAAEYLELKWELHTFSTNEKPFTLILIPETWLLEFSLSYHITRGHFPWGVKIACRPRVIFPNLTPFKDPRYYLRKGMSVTACSLCFYCILSECLLTKLCVISCELMCVTMKDFLKCFPSLVSVIMQYDCLRKNFKREL